MRKKLLILCMSVMLCTCMCGCWDYRGINELAIVAGMAIDEPENGEDGIIVSFEIVSLSSSDGNAKPKPILVQTEGKTLAEAVYKANNKVNNNMYFGNAETVIISRAVAEKQGLEVFIDPLLRDVEMRNNLFIIISGEEKAKDVIKSTDDETIVSYDINPNIGFASENIDSHKTWPLYRIYNTLSTGDLGITLPIVGLSHKREGEMELSGLAVFSNDKMIGALPYDEVPFYLLAAGKSGNNSFDIFQEYQNGEKSVTLTVRKSRSKYDVEHSGDQFVFNVDIDADVAAVEFSPGWGDITSDTVRKTEQLSSQKLSTDIASFIQKAQKTYGVDIFGFGEYLRTHDAKLWESVKDNWDNAFASAQINVNCKLKIQDTGLIKKY